MRPDFSAEPPGSASGGDRLPARRLPTLLLAGYLGAGKTTRINHWLREASLRGGPRLAVLVNDFGELSIDADLIVAQEGSVLTLSGGCLCCSFGDDLVGSLQGLAQREDAPDAVLIEASGVALPGAVARGARLAPAVKWIGTLVVVDACAVQRQAMDRYVGDTVRQQLNDADWLWASKLDEARAPAPETLEAWLRAQGVRGPLWRRVELDALWRLLTGDERPVCLTPTHQPHAGSHGDGSSSAWPARPWGAARASAHPFLAHRMRRLEGCTVAQLRAALSEASDALARAKCLLRDDAGAAWAVHLAGGQVRVEAAAFSGPPRGVLISLRGREIGAALAAWI